MENVDIEMDTDEEIEDIVFLEPLKSYNQSLKEFISTLSKVGKWIESNIQSNVGDVLLRVIDVQLSIEAAEVEKRSNAPQKSIHDFFSSK